MSQNLFHGYHCSTSQMVDFVGATYINNNNNNTKGVWGGSVRRDLWVDGWGGPFPLVVYFCCCWPKLTPTFTTQIWHKKKLSKKFISVFLRAPCIHEHPLLEKKKGRDYLCLISGMISFHLLNKYLLKLGSV